MRVRVRKSFKASAGVRARKNAKGAIVVVGGKGYIALALLALVLTACSGSGPATTPPGTTAPGTTAPGTTAPGTTQPATTPPSGTGTQCVTSSRSGNCGPYRYAADTNSNGYNTHVANNCWADPSCVQTITVANPGNWQVTSTEPARNGSVRTAPEIGQLFNNWCADGKNTWSNFVSNGCGGSADTPISALSQLTSSYAEATPHNSQTIAEWAWDNWLSNDAGYPREVMVWVDNSGRCNRGSYGFQVHAPVTIAGQEWTPRRYRPNGNEFIWSLDGPGGPGTCAQQASGTVDLLALLKWMQANGFAAPSASISLIDGLWEICSTGGVPETFRVSSYSITARAG